LNKGGDKESVISLPNAQKLQDALDDIALSDEEDELFVSKIEYAQNVRLKAEVDDNGVLRKQVTSLHGALRR
jgi:uncharacterized protein YukE